MNRSDSKMIRITSRGFVTTSRGRVISPIMSPYRETLDRIWNMITADRADVEEKLPDGNFIKLTTQNFDKNNFVSKEPVAPVPNKPVEKEDTEKTWETPEIKDVPKNDVETPVESTEPVNEPDGSPVEETSVDTKNEEEKNKRPLTPNEIRKNRKNKNKKKGFNQSEENYKNDEPDGSPVKEASDKEEEKKTDDAAIAVDVENVE